MNSITDQQAMQEAWGVDWSASEADHFIATMCPYNENDTHAPLTADEREQIWRASTPEERVRWEEDRELWERIRQQESMAVPQ